MTPPPTPPAERPPLRLVHGDATPEEIAALLTVLTAMSSNAHPTAPRHTSQWASRERSVRLPVSPAPNGWRASALPH